MKNIHILPTDNLSSLCFNEDKNKFTLKHQLSEGTNAWRTQNIYIISDEEIKEGDWITDGTKIILNRSWVDDEDYKKIILTTDIDLIKSISNPVQAIDDEFLEWFVKNPSCEYVDLIGLRKEKGYEFLGYEIIIPKEEPKFVTVNIESAKGEDLGKVTYIPLPNIDYIPKQETVEESAFAFTAGKSVKEIYSRMDFVKGAKFGAKWQQERSYSEEEVRRIAYNAYCLGQLDSPTENKFNGWFEQFKKK